MINWEECVEKERAFFPLYSSLFLFVKQESLHFYFSLGPNEIM